MTIYTNFNIDRMTGFSCVPQVFAGYYFHLCHQSIQKCNSYTFLSPQQYSVRMKGICCFNSLITQYTNVMDFHSVTETCRQAAHYYYYCCSNSFGITVWPFNSQCTMDIWMQQQLGKSVSFLISIQFYKKLFAFFSPRKKFSTFFTK